MKEFSFTPREYQLKARFNVNESLNNGNHPLLVMPTGTGKTKTAAMIIHDRIKLGQIVYVLCPQVEIFSQLMEDFAFMNPGYINDESMRGRDRRLYICMAMSLFNLISMIPESLYPDVIVSDECHHSKCVTWNSIYDYFGSALRVGMTATPIRIDGKHLGDLYNDLIEPITIKEAIKEGFLTPPVVIAPEEYKDNIPMKGDDFDMEKQAEILGKCKIIGDVIEAYERIIPGKSMLVACCTFDHAESVKNDFNQSGWIAEHIHSNLPKHERKGMLNRISSGKTNILTTVGIGIEGLDVSGIHGLAWLRRTMSITIKVQFDGRPMRLADDKKFCFIFDPVGNTVIHGMPDRVRKWYLTEGEEIEKADRVPFKSCYSCGVYNAPENLECHWCGADLSDEARQKNKKPRSLPAMIDGKMVAITTDGEIQEIKNRAEKVKAEQLELIESEKKKNEKLEEIGEMKKREILRSGLFSDGNRRELFKEALEGWR